MQTVPQAPDQGLPGREYVVIWKQVKQSPADGRRTVGLMLDAKIFPPERYNVAFPCDRIAVLRAKFGHVRVHYVIAYAPHANSPKADRDEFWAALEDTLGKIGNQRIVLLGDLNAHTGDHRLDRQHGANDNGWALLDIMDNFNLVSLIMSQTFMKKPRFRRHLWTWKMSVRQARQKRSQPERKEGSTRCNRRIRNRNKKRRNNNTPSPRHALFHVGGRPSKRRRDLVKHQKRQQQANDETEEDLSLIHI